MEPINNGKELEKQFPNSSIIEFKPKGQIGGRSVLGIVTGRIYNNCLFVDCPFTSRKYFISVNRVDKIIARP